MLRVHIGTHDCYLSCVYLSVIMPSINTEPVSMVSIYSCRADPQKKVMIIEKQRLQSVDMSLLTGPFSGHIYGITLVAMYVLLYNVKSW